MTGNRNRPEPEPDPYIPACDRFPRYRNQTPAVRELSIDLMENGIKSGQLLHCSIPNIKHDNTKMFTASSKEFAISQ
jgi:hypothetical protein